MELRILQTPAELQTYDTWVKLHPQANFWQSLERKKYLEALGKEVRLYATGTPDFQATALVVIDKTSFGLQTWDIPRGPLWRSGVDVRSFLEAILAQAKREKCMALYVSPLLVFDRQFKPSPRHIHCEATIMLDLTMSDDELLAQMKPKGRYNIRVAEKNGVTVRQSDDIEAFYRLVSATSNRDGFTALPKAKYQAFLGEVKDSFLLIAYSPNQEPIAGLIGLLWGGVGIYYYGASSYAHRALMAPYKLQWEAMRLCKARGATAYDFLGVAPPAASSNHPWAGITRFKEQFGGTVETYPAEQVIILRPITHRLLTLKRILFR